jgi:hypothetical protein
MDKDKKGRISRLCQNTIKYSEPEKNYGPVGSNTDSDSKMGVQCKDSSIMYLAFIIKNLF